MEPKLSIIKAHLKHRRHVKLVSQQDNPNQFEPRPDTTGILAEDEKQEKKKRNSIIGNADVVTDVDGWLIFIRFVDLKNIIYEWANTLKCYLFIFNHSMQQDERCHD